MMAVFEEEEIFIGENSRVLFNGQPCGIILADTFDLANYAATKVKVIYGEKDGNLPIKYYSILYYISISFHF